jgi:hypothetical protein
MAYVSPWERLGDAVARVVSEAGVSEDEGTNRPVPSSCPIGWCSFKGKLLRHAKNQFTDRVFLEGQAFQIPPRLGPQDFDWERSRPVKPWTVRRGSYPLHGPWKLELVEVWRDDVTKVLCPPAQVVVQSGLPVPSRKSAKKRSAPGLESARRAIKVLYPESVPGQSVITNKILCQRVVEQLKKDGSPEVSNDTILRAAARRK